MKAFLLCLVLGSSTMPLFSQDIVFKSSGSPSSLVELYSSEGCSSCPPAEEWLNQLKGSPELWKSVFPLAFHVDYWDGLGWPDRFARADYTQRQRDYAARLNQDSVYTPEFVVNGLEWHRGWLSGQGIPAMGGEKSGGLVVTVSKADKKISAEFALGEPMSSEPLVLNVALLGFDLVTDVKRGENGGRTLKHDFVVLNLSSTDMLAQADGKFRAAPVEIKSSTGDVPSAVVAWVSKADGSVLQIAGGWLSSIGH